MSFNTKLIDLLKTDPRFVDDEGELVLAAVQDRAWKIDRDLVKLLLSDKEIKAKFFDEIEGHWIFNTNTFIDYISQKNFLDNSYTRFRNRIGLTIGGKYLRERGEVALVWPYKDTVLEGGQTKEEEKRKEIFFNEVLAQDEINRLLDPKVLTNFARYTAKGKEKVTGFKRDENGVIRENLIIKGNNLLALHTLKTQFRRQVKLIYIDPPFNTGDDEFGYNDRFNHSAWLTFIWNRLAACKEMMSPDGVICVNIGNQEVSYLQVLMDEIFHSENYLNHIVMTTNDPSGFKATSSKIFSTANHLLIYRSAPKGEKLKKIFVKKSYDPAYKFVLLNPRDNYKEWKFATILECLARRENLESTRQLKQKYSEHDLLEMVEKFADENKAVVFRTAAIGGGARAKRQATIKKSKEDKGRVYQHPGENVEGFYILNGEQIIFWENIYKEIDGEAVPAEALTDVWTDISWTGIANEGGVTFKNGKKPVV
jgi:adenine-specific DNA-methyltransferase